MTIDSLLNVAPVSQRKRLPPRAGESVKTAPQPSARRAGALIFLQSQEFQPSDSVLRRELIYTLASAFSSRRMISSPLSLRLIITTSTAAVAVTCRRSAEIAVQVGPCGRYDDLIKQSKSARLYIRQYKFRREQTLVCRQSTRLLFVGLKYRLSRKVGGFSLSDLVRLTG